MAGASLRKAAEIGGVSHEAVKAYKVKVVIPAMRKAQEIQSFLPLDKPDSVKVQEHTSLTRDIVRTSVFRDRLEKLWEKTENAIERAETAVRTVVDPDTGQLVAVGPDVAAIAPILNQAHKNVHMLGVATGEIEQVAANIAIQIVLPQQQAESAPTVGKSGDEDVHETIDITPVKL